MTITHQDLQTDSLRLHVALSGPEDGPPVVLLHGFPEYWGGWKPHIPALAAAGYRVIVPDQRGYGTSEKPPRIKDYALDRLAEDVTGLLDALGYESAHIVGHDWGGAVAWQVARGAAGRVRKLVVINCPPFDVMQSAGLRNPMQILRSWYIFFFQLPLLPQWLLSIARFSLLGRTMIKSALPGTFSVQGLEDHRTAWSQPRALRSMINWYRAGLYAPKSRPRIEVPTLLLWGERDRFLGRGLIKSTEALCDDVRIVRFPDNTHWLPHEAPDRVTAEMLDFFGPPAPDEDATITPPSATPE